MNARARNELDFKLHVGLFELGTATVNATQQRSFIDYLSHVCNDQRVCIRARDEQIPATAPTTSTTRERAGR